MKALLLLITLVSLSTFQVALSAPKKSIKHNHGSRIHIHPLPETGTNHNHNKAKPVKNKSPKITFGKTTLKGTSSYSQPVADTKQPKIGSGTIITAGVSSSSQPVADTKQPKIGSGTIITTGVSSSSQLVSDTKQPKTGSGTIITAGVGSSNQPVADTKQPKIGSGTIITTGVSSSSQPVADTKQPKTSSETLTATGTSPTSQLKSNEASSTKQNELSKELMILARDTAIASKRSKNLASIIIKVGKKSIIRNGKKAYVLNSASDRMYNSLKHTASLNDKLYRQYLRKQNILGNHRIKIRHEVLRSITAETEIHALANKNSASLATIVTNPIDNNRHLDWSIRRIEEISSRVVTLQ